MDQFLGQLLLVPYSFAPRGWAFCQGQLVPISQNTALFSLLGTQYGGDGRSSFALPNLMGMVPTGVGTGAGLPAVLQGQTGGEPSVLLNSTMMPAHTHQQMGTTSGAGTNLPNGATFGQGLGKGHTIEYYIAPSSSTAQMAGMSLQPVGSGQSHPNLMPSLVMNYIIALQGIFPPRP